MRRESRLIGKAHTFMSDVVIIMWNFVYRCIPNVIGIINLGKFLSNFRKDGSRVLFLISLTISIMTT